jgi:hypothetical protein
MRQARPTFERALSTADMQDKVDEQNALITKWAPVLTGDRVAADSLHGRANMARRPWSLGDRSGLSADSLVNAAHYAARGRTLGGSK